MQLRMEQKHIDRGEIGSMDDCPVALLLYEQTGLLPRVSNHWISLRDPQTKRVVWSGHTPAMVKRFIARFDGRGRSGVTPIVFRIGYQGENREDQG